MFRSVIHFFYADFFIWYKCPASFFCMSLSSFPITICWWHCAFPMEWSWRFCSRSFDCMCEGFFIYLYFGFYSVSLVYMPVFMQIPHYFDYCNFVICLEIGKCGFFNFVFLQTCFGLRFYMNFRIFPYFCKKNAIRILNVGSLDCFGRHWHLDNIKSFNLCTWDSLHFTCLCSFL